MSNVHTTLSPVQPVVRVAPLGELRVYLISEAELDTLATGGPDSIFLTFATFFFSAFISFLITLATTEIKNDRLFYSFLIVCCISGIAALVLGALWWRNRVSSKRLVKEIKRRMPPSTGVQEITRVS
jgi:hypothetical protein